MAVTMGVFVRACGPSATDNARVYRYSSRDTGGLVMIREGRLLWLTTWEWSLLLASAALCGCLTLLGA